MCALAKVHVLWTPRRKMLSVCVKRGTLATNATKRAPQTRMEMFAMGMENASLIPKERMQNVSAQGVSSAPTVLTTVLEVGNQEEKWPAVGEGPVIWGKAKGKQQLSASVRRGILARDAN